jgi:MFS transporter, ACS family, glucarate transporter
LAETAAEQPQVQTSRRGEPRNRLPIRYAVVAFAVSLAMLTYLDRVCISALSSAIMGDLALSRLQMSYVFSAFTLSYGIFEIPTAWWADRVGSRRVISRIVAWWSAFTVVTGAAWSYGSLLVIRFLFGAGEAGAWPNVARVFSRWIPADERGTMQGIFFAGAHLAGGLTPILVFALSKWFGWRTIFVIFGMIGFLWAWCWYRWFRDEPAEHRSVGEAELRKIEAERGLPPQHHLAGFRWRTLLGNRSVLALCASYFANGYGFYFVITWLPAYLAKARGFESVELGLFAGLPLILSVVSDIGGGWTTDRLCRRFGLRLGRCAVASGANLLAALAMLAGAATADSRVAALLIAVALASSMFTLGPSWAACIDIGGRSSAVVSAAMNTAGQIGGILSPIVLALVVDRFANWAIPLYLMAGLYLMAAIVWLAVRPDLKLGEGAAQRLP